MEVIINLLSIIPIVVTCMSCACPDHCYNNLLFTLHVVSWPETTGGIPVYTLSILLLLKSSLS